MPRVGFEPTIPVFEWAKTVHAIDRAATVISFPWCLPVLYFSLLKRIFTFLFCYEINPMQSVGFEVPTAVVMKSYIFCDITSCSPLKVNRRFGGACCLHLQGRRISEARNQVYLLHSSCLFGLFFDPEDGDNMLLRYFVWLSNGLHSVISQKIEFYFLPLQINNINVPVLTNNRMNKYPRIMKYFSVPHFLKSL
jgi:hypothetical protein